MTTNELGGITQSIVRSLREVIAHARGRATTTRATQRLQRERAARRDAYFDEVRLRQERRRLWIR
jgi:hypothetical protein